LIINAANAWEQMNITDKASVVTQGVLTVGTVIVLKRVGGGTPAAEAALSDAALAEGRFSDLIVKTGKSALAADITTNITAEEFGGNLEANGYIQSVAKDGVTTMYTKGNQIYSVYPKSPSTGGPTANLNEGGKIVTKIRLQ
jgi:hypothetical protein